MMTNIPAMLYVWNDQEAMVFDAAVFWLKVLVVFILYCVVATLILLRIRR